MHPKLCGASGRCFAQDARPSARFCTGFSATDEAVKVALAANLSYYHDDPDRMSFLRYAVPQASYLTGGGHYVRGGSAALIDTLSRADS